MKEELHDYFNNRILDKLSEVNEDEEVVKFKIGEDEYPLDIPTYIYYFMKK